MHELKAYVKLHLKIEMKQKRFDLSYTFEQIAHQTEQTACNMYLV